MYLISEIEAITQTITEWVGKYYSNGLFFVLAIIAFVYLYIVCEDLRKKFLIPIVVIMCLVLNPVLYKYIFSRAVYWRMLWAFPNTILIALGLTTFIKRCDKSWMKSAIIILASMIIIAKGTHVFTYGNFTERSNWEKISQATINVCDIMTEIDDTPKAVVPSAIFTEVRQYAPEVNMMYGRNAHWYIMWISELATSVYNEMESEVPDYDYVLSTCVDKEYNFVVVIDSKAIPNNILEKYSYERVGQTDGMIVYYNSELEE